MKRPLSARNVNVANLGTTFGADEVPFRKKCAGILVVTGSFSGGVEWSWGPVDNGPSYPLAQGVVALIEPGDRIYLRDAGGLATGTAQFTLLPVLPDDHDKAIATAAVLGALGQTLGLADVLDELRAMTPTVVHALGTSAANTAQNLDIAAQGAGTRLVVKYAHVAVRAAAVGTEGVVAINDDGATGTAVWQTVFGLGMARGSAVEFGPVNQPGAGLLVDENALARLEVPALGAGAISEAFMIAEVEIL